MQLPIQLFHDAIYIVTLTPARGEAIKQSIALRDFDEVLCISAENAALLLQANPPALAIIDLEGNTQKTIELMLQLPATVKSIVLSDTFDEELFFAAHDHGARDFMVKPVADADLVARVIRTLQERRLERVMMQKDRILVEMGVLSTRSGVFTTSYLLKMLKQEAEHVSPYAADPLSLLVVQLGGYQSPLPEELHNALASEVAGIIKDCTRGFDMVGEYFLDKFAVILPQTGSRGARALGKRLMSRLNGYEFKSPAGNLSLQLRIGMGEYTGCRHYEDLINRALEDLKTASSGPKSMI